MAEPLWQYGSDEIAAEAKGVDTTMYKVLAFSIGAAFAGALRGGFAHHQMFIDPRSLPSMGPLEILVMVVLGGLGSITGSIIAAVEQPFAGGAAGNGGV